MTSTYGDMPALLNAVRACRVCEAHLPLGLRPALQGGVGASILVVGQAPGARVHASGVPWDDASGDRLRARMGIDKATFYDAEQIALIPMGLCYPGRGASGDLPPRPECAPLQVGLSGSGSWAPLRPGAITRSQEPALCAR